MPTWAGLRRYEPTYLSEGRRSPRRWTRAVQSFDARLEPETWAPIQAHAQVEPKPAQAGMSSYPVRRAAG